MLRHLPESALDQMYAMKFMLLGGIASLLMAALVSCAPLRYERTVGTGTYYRTDAERIEATEFPKLSEP